MNLVVFDLETTGTSIMDDEIIQIGAVCVNADTGVELGDFEIKLMPSPKGQEGLAAMKAEGFKNSYDAEVWAKMAVFPALGLGRFAGWVGRWKDLPRQSKNGKTYYVVQGCGYNALRFDHPFILEACRKHGNIFMPMDMLCWDTLPLAMMVFYAHGIHVPDFKLETVAKALDVPLVNAHDALADVRATAHITMKLLDMVEFGVKKS